MKASCGRRSRKLAALSAAMATVNAVLGVQRTLLQVQRQELETAQTMRFQKQDASLELLDGMANIQRQVIDLNQLGVVTPTDADGEARSE